ncbi:MAG: PspA/IM30 family protein [Lachnospiraceae bacterium]|nr:PspA/IM30 family protein [Lachnospiraceae bacterium]
MGILSRFSDIMKSNINALLDKCEDPSKMVDQMLRDLREDLVQVKKETASVMADEKKAKRQLDECDAEIRKYTTAAQNALRAGNEEDAKVLIAKKQQYEADRASLQSTYQVAQENAEKMHQMHDKLVNDIDTLEMKKDAIKAKVATAKAQEHMNKIMSGGKNSEASIAAFERMEAKADRMLDSAVAEAELNAGANKASNLADRYTGGGTDIQVEDELARMKAELGL